MLYTIFILIGKVLDIISEFAGLCAAIDFIGLLGAVVMWNTDFFIPGLQVLARSIIAVVVFHLIAVFFLAQADNIRTNEILKNMDNKREQ